MGTVTVGLSTGQLSGDFSMLLQNYLVEANPKLNKKHRREHKLDSKSERLKFGYRKTTYGITKDGLFIHLASDPTSFFNELPDVKILVHLSQWNNLRHLIETFVEIFGLKNAHAICFHGRIVRVDFWLDLDVSYKTMNKSTYRPHVTTSSTIAGNLRTQRLGAKGLKQAQFYEKPRSKVRRRNLDYKPKIDEGRENYIRLEVRYEGKRCPIKKLADYPSSKDSNVFSHVKIQRCSIKKILRDSSLTNKKKDLIRGFLSTSSNDGLTFARREYNKNRDFYRNIAPILKKHERRLSPSERWAKKLETQIIAGFDIKAYFENKGIV